MSPNVLRPTRRLLVRPFALWTETIIKRVFAAFSVHKEIEPQMTPFLVSSTFAIAVTV